MSALLTSPSAQAVEDFALRVGQEVAAASSIALAVLGDRLGLYGALAASGPAAPAELAARTGCQERLVREWLANQAAGGWVVYDVETGRFSLPLAHVPALADRGSPAFQLGSAQTATAVHQVLPALERVFRGTGTLPYDEQPGDLHEGVDRFFQTACGPYLADWVAALEGQARSPRRVVDLGCGRGWAALALAQAFPGCHVVGVDSSPRVVSAARQAAEDAGLQDRVSFRAGAAQDLVEQGFDLACLLDVLHDTGDPVAVAGAARRALGPGGALLVVEPAAGDRLEDNLHWLGRAYYAISTAACTPGALSQEGGWALGGQAGPQRLRAVLAEAGFTRVREVASTPFQMVLEARP